MVCFHHGANSHHGINPRHDEFTAYQESKWTSLRPSPPPSHAVQVQVFESGFGRPSSGPGPQRLPAPAYGSRRVMRSPAPATSVTGTGGPQSRRLRPQLSVWSTVTVTVRPGPLAAPDLSPGPAGPVAAARAAGSRDRSRK
jgi:hypothetical protein